MLLDLYQGRRPGFLGEEPTEPASEPERNKSLREAEDELFRQLAPALPSHEPTKFNVHSHAGRREAVRLRGEIILWWAKAEGMKPTKAVERACDITGVERSTGFDWLKAVDKEHRQRIELMAEALAKGSPAEWVETARAYSSLYTEAALFVIHEASRRRSSKKTI
jgi:hypothetical protein